MPRRYIENASLSLALVFTIAAERPASEKDSVILTYRPPRIALVQPAVGGTLQQDRPAVVFRFTAGEAGDPLDVKSFAVSVDARDHTSSFQVSATEAWGLVASDPSDLSIGAHQIAARICSLRGACSSTAATITVSKPIVAGDQDATAKDLTKKRRVLNALLSALRTLIKE